MLSKNKRPRPFALGLSHRTHLAQATLPQHHQLLRRNKSGCLSAQLTGRIPLLRDKGLVVLLVAGKKSFRNRNVTTSDDSCSGERRFHLSNDYEPREKLHVDEIAKR